MHTTNALQFIHNAQKHEIPYHVYVGTKMDCWQTEGYAFDTLVYMYM